MVTMDLKELTQMSKESNSGVLVKTVPVHLSLSGSTAGQELEGRYRYRAVPYRRS